MSYEDELNQTKAAYPFEEWLARGEGEDGLEQYTPEAVAAARAVVDRLLVELAALGRDAPEAAKIERFGVAVEALNVQNDESDSALIETEEREELCEMFNVIAEAAGIDPEKYGDGEGPASEFRDW